MVNTEISLIIFFFSQRWRNSIQSAETRLGVDRGSDHELLIAKFRLKWKKVGKTTRPFRYDLSQIPYNYTVEVKNRFKGLDLIDTVPEELWTEVWDIVQETRIKIIPKKKKCKKAKWLSEEGLTNICEKKRSEKQRRKGKISPFECRVSKNSKEREDNLPQQSMQTEDNNNRMGKTRDPFKTSLSLFTFMHWRRKWQPTPVFLPGESQGQRSLVGCHLWGHTESDMTEAT